MEEKTEAGYAGQFQALIAQKKCRDILPKGNYPAGLVLFLRKSRRRRTNIFICINDKCKAPLIIAKMSKPEQMSEGVSKPFKILLARQDKCGIKGKCFLSAKRAGDL